MIGLCWRVGQGDPASGLVRFKNGVRHELGSASILEARDRGALLDVVSEHSVALLSVVRALVDGIDTGDTGPTPPPEPDGPPEGPTPPDPGGPAGPAGPSSHTPGPGRYQHIPVTVEE